MLKRKFFLLFLMFFPFFALVADSTKTSAPAKTEQFASSASETTPELSSDETPPLSVDATDSYEHSFIKMLVTLFGLLVLIFLTVWMLRKIAGGKLKNLNHARTIKIIERRPLSAKSILYLIEVGGKQVLISESQLEVRALSSIEEIPPANS